jgi:hypothetical protein
MLFLHLMAWLRPHHQQDAQRTAHPLLSISPSSSMLCCSTVTFQLNGKSHKWSSSLSLGSPQTPHPLTGLSVSYPLHPKSLRSSFSTGSFRWLNMANYYPPISSASYRGTPQLNKLIVSSAELTTPTIKANRALQPSLTSLKHMTRFGIWTALDSVSN